MKRALIVLGAALVLMLGGMVAYAAIPSADGTFTACMVKTSGTIRMVEPTATCRTGEQKISWNQAGQPGEDGTDAPDFATQLYPARTGSGYAISEGWIFESFCDAGDRVIGIYNQIINSGSGISATSLQIIEANGREGYRQAIIDQGNPGGQITPLCLDLTP